MEHARGAVRILEKDVRELVTEKEFPHHQLDGAKELLRVIGTRCNNSANGFYGKR